MFLTRSLWRKMVFGLGLVLLMLTILSLSGIVGLASYRHIVHDPIFDPLQTPRQADLLAALSSLQVALEPPSVQDTLRVGSPHFTEELQKARDVIRRYRLRLDELPPSSRTDVTRRMLDGIEAGLKSLQQQYEELGNPLRNPLPARRLQQQVLPLLQMAAFVPDSQDGYTARLRQARRAYETSFTILCVTSGVAVALFVGLVVCGYRWIFRPLRELHQGARRVAQGDFDYRLRLKTNDEMAELAEAFNQMTERFQEIANHLDQEVQARSRELVRSARLASVGFLAAGVAHEINNPLTAIKWAAESLSERALLGEAIPADEVTTRYLGMIQREADRCQQITSKLLDFARGRDSTRTRSDLVQLVREVLELVSHTSKFRDRQIELKRTEPCFAEVNPSEIKQVILNLVSNALQATDPGGRVEIELRERTDQVVLTVRDNGCGMTPEVLENLFEPFFTEQRDGKGTGLGLCISHRIVRDHGGRMEAESEGPGRGSTLRVWLPRRAAPSSHAA